MPPLQIFYLTLSVCGMVGTWYFNLQIDNLAGFFVDAWATPLSSSLSMDLLVVVVSFFAFMLVERKRLSMSSVVVGVLMVLTFAIAVAFTLPLFLFLRERAAVRYCRHEDRAVGAVGRPDAMRRSGDEAR